MTIEYNNLYTHFILITENRNPSIPEKSRQRIEKYITGIVNNNQSKLYSIYANPEHIHLLISRSPVLSEQSIATIISESTLKFINDNKLCPGRFAWQQSAAAFSISKASRLIGNKKISFATEYDSFIKHYQKTLKWEIR